LKSKIAKPAAITVGVDVFDLRRIRMSSKVDKNAVVLNENRERRSYQTETREFMVKVLGPLPYRSVNSMSATAAEVDVSWIRTYLCQSPRFFIVVNYSPSFSFFPKTIWSRQP